MISWILKKLACARGQTFSASSKRGRKSDLRQESGVAIMLVLFIVILTTTLVVSLARSTYLGGRVNASIEKGLRAEYLVKSALSVAQILIQQDKTLYDDPADPWKIFENGTEIPAEWVGIDEPNIKIELEISPLGKKFPLSRIVPAGTPPTPDPKWLSATVRLFKILGFDTDGETDQSGAFAGTRFTSEELAGNLIDYIDDDNDTFISGAVRGVEGTLPPKTFPNRPLSREAELANIPGFTPARVQKLLQYASIDRNVNPVNINSAPLEVISSLHPDLEHGQAQDILDYMKKNGPFKNVGDVQPIVSSYNAFYTMIDVRSNRFTVIAKVDFTAVVMFLRATLNSAGSGSLPVVESVEIY